MPRKRGSSYSPHEFFRLCPTLTFVVDEFGRIILETAPSPQSWHATQNCDNASSPHHNMNSPFTKLLLTVCLLALGFVPPRSSAQQPPDKQTQSQSSQQQQQKTPPPVQKKTDIEKKTGTVNDRLFEAMPNYVVEDAKKLPALKPREKFGLAGASVFDPF